MEIVNPGVLGLRVAELICAVVGASPTSRDAYARSLLAVLLEESHRSSAYVGWGYRSMRAYAQEYGMLATTYSKYLVAGSVLLRVDDTTYWEVLRCVGAGAPSSEYPPLPPLEKLYGAHRTLVSRGAEAARRMLDKTYAVHMAHSKVRCDEGEATRSLRVLLTSIRDARVKLSGHGASACPRLLVDQIDHELTALAGELRKEKLNS